MGGFDPNSRMPISGDPRPIFYNSFLSPFLQAMQNAIHYNTSGANSVSMNVAPASTGTVSPAATPSPAQGAVVGSLGSVPPQQVPAATAPGGAPQLSTVPPGTPTAGPTTPNPFVQPNPTSAVAPLNPAMAAATFDPATAAILAALQGGQLGGGGVESIGGNGPAGGLGGAGGGPPGGTGGFGGDALSGGGPTQV